MTPEQFAKMVDSDHELAVYWIDTRGVPAGSLVEDILDYIREYTSNGESPEDTVDSLLLEMGLYNSKSH